MSVSMHLHVYIRINTNSWSVSSFYPSLFVGKACIHHWIDEQTDI